MAEKQERGVADSDDLQDVGLRGLRKEDDLVISVTRGSGSLSIRAMRVHHSHVQAGRKRDTRCGFCSAGLEGVLESAETIQTREPIVEVVPSSGADEEGDASPAPGDGAGDGQAKMLWERPI